MPAIVSAARGPVVRPGAPGWPRPMRPARPDSASARPSRLVLALLLLLGGTFVFAGQGVVPIIVDGGLAAYAIGLALP